MKNKKAALRERHLTRFFQFKGIEIEEKLAFYESKVMVFFMLFFVVLVLSFAFFFTSYKEFVFKAGIFTIFIALYKCYEAYFTPVIKLDSKRITFRFDRYNWSDLKKINMHFKNNYWIFVLVFYSGKKIEKKIPYSKLENSFQLPLILKSFKRKYRRKFHLKY